MALGPVLRYELIATSRRGRYYGARVAYGLFLLWTLWLEHGRLSAAVVGELSARDMARLAEAVFVAFLWAQWVTLLVVVPALVAGVIADAHRRKTLRDLLASGLSARAIVLGKLGARLVHVGVFVATGVPVVALVGLFGGLDPWEVLLCYAGTASIALALGGVSVLASTLARRPREAVLAAYALEVAWLVLPPLLSGFIPYMVWPISRLSVVNEYILYTDPILIWMTLNAVLRMKTSSMNMAWVAARSGELHTYFLIMAGLQTAFGLACTALAVGLLRPLRAGDMAGPWSWPWSRSRRGGRAAAARSRPACGDDPMMWKERRAAPRSGVAVLASRPAVLFLGTLLGCYLFDIAVQAVEELLGARGGGGAGRRELNVAVRTTVAGLSVLWLLAVASAAAVSFTSEREDDTWTSLTATLLTGAEVVRAKAAGALWGARWLALAGLTVIALGVVGGAVHPLGAVLAVAALAASGAFASALGVSFSLGAKSSTRALVATVLTLVAVNVGLPLAASLTGEPPPEFPPWWLAATAPMLGWVSLVSYPEARAFGAGEAFQQVEGFLPKYGPGALAVVLTGAGFFAAAAKVLTAAASEGYERVAGRARRPAARPGSSPDAARSRPARAGAGSPGAVRADGAPGGGR